MSYQDAWRPIEARIQSIAKAAELNHAFGVTTDGWGRMKYVSTQCVRTFAALRAFHSSYSSGLPTVAKSALEEFLRSQGPIIENQDPSDQTRIAWHAAVVLAALASELSYLFSDEQNTIRSRTEVAFAHLQRLIVVDADFRNGWQKALATGEVECERRGSLHLLWHQILAFKVNADGARTDLVFSEPFPSDLSQRAAGLVLTEWKVARKADQIAKKFAEAREQAKLYSDGPLSGVELRAYRYLVVVSENYQSQDRADIEDSGVTYRHINLAVRPDAPSVASKKATIK